MNPIVYLGAMTLLSVGPAQVLQAAQDAENFDLSGVCLEDFSDNDPFADLPAPGIVPQTETWQDKVSNLLKLEMPEWAKTAPRTGQRKALRDARKQLEQQLSQEKCGNRTERRGFVKRAQFA